MELKEVLKRHKRLLTLNFNEAVLSLVKRVILELQDNPILDDALDILEIFARRAIISDDYYLECSRVAEFFSNDEIRAKEYFSDLLKDFKYLMNNCSELERDKKIGLIVLIISNSKDVSYEVLKNIMYGSRHNTVYTFLGKLFNEATGLSTEYFEIVLEEALKANVDYQRKDEELSYIIDILNNELILSLDKNQYKRIVKLCFDNAFWYYINLLLTSDLDIAKKKVALDYYLEVIPKCAKRIICLNWNNLDYDFRQDVFEVVFALKNLDIGLYKQTLTGIVEAPDMRFQAKILSSNLRSDYQMKAISYQKVPNSEKNKKINKYLGSAAIYPLINSLSLDDYERILDFLKKLVEEIYVDEDEKRRKIVKSKIKTLLNIFKCDFYKYNLVRLEYVVRLILELDDIFAIYMIGDFAGNIYAEYYDDLEYKRAIEILCDTSVIDFSKRIVGSKYFLFSKLFTNINVPYMDRNTLMDIAISEDENVISELIHKLNELGLQNQNMARLLDNADCFLEYDRSRKLAENL